jgi:hypothetical protein
VIGKLWQRFSDKTFEEGNCLDYWLVGIVLGIGKFNFDFNGITLAIVRIMLKIIVSLSFILRRNLYRIEHNKVLFK